MSRVNKTDSVLVLLKVKKPANLAETRNKKGKTLGKTQPGSVSRWPVGPGCSCLLTASYCTFSF